MEERMFSVGDIDVPASAQPELAAIYDQIGDDMKVFRKSPDTARIAEMMGESVMPNLRRFVEIVTAKVGLIEHMIESGALGGDGDDGDLRLDEEQANLFLSTLEATQSLVKGMIDAASIAPPDQQASIKMLGDNIAQCIAILKEHFDDGEETAAS